jgi:hypothetical protein
MKRGDYVRLPDGRVGIYSEPLFGVAVRVIMPDWSIETCNMDKLELIGAKDESYQKEFMHILNLASGEKDNKDYFLKDVPVKLPEGAALGNGAKTTNTASSGVWIFIDKWYKTQSQWEGGYFVEGKWVSPKEVKKVKRIDNFRFLAPYGIDYDKLVQLLVEDWEEAVDHVPEKMIDTEFTKKLERFMDENKPIAPPKVGDWVSCGEPEGYVTHVDDEFVKFTDKSGTVFTAPVTDVDIINKPYREESFNPGDRVATPYGEGVVEEAYPSYMIVKINGSLRWVNYEEMKPEGKKMSPGWNDIYTEVGGLMWKTGEAELDTVLHMINDYSAFWVEAQGVKDINRYVAKKLLEKYTIHRK